MAEIPPPKDKPDKPVKRSTAHRISKLMQQLQDLSKTRVSNEQFQDICVAVQALPPGDRPQALMLEVARVFNKTSEEVSNILRTRADHSDFDLLVPTEGWIAEYLEWTRQTEPPTVFHFFAAAVALGVSIGRRVFFDKGAYQVFPNLCIMLIAPAGRCRKTSCANLAASIIMQSGGKIMADKVTPESLIDAVKEHPVALVFAQELSVLLGKQKYNEGMVQLLTTLFDCPKEWTAKTMGRGETVLSNVALSGLMCSTQDWLKTGIPADSFGGGFMSRFLFIVQESTPRCFPLPPALDSKVAKHLVGTLAKLGQTKAAARMSASAAAWYDDWYRKRIHNRPAEGQFAGYYERKPDHLLRLTMVMKVAEAKGPQIGMELGEADLVRAERILSWLERFLPATFDQVASSQSGEDHMRILRQLRLHGGSMDHSTLLRRNSSRMNSETFKRAIATLRDSKLVEWDAAAKTYLLTVEGWGN